MARSSSTWPTTGCTLRSMSDTRREAHPGLRHGNHACEPRVFTGQPLHRLLFAARTRAIKKIAVSGGTAVTICPADPLSGMGWDADGIVFGQSSKGIMRVSSNGGPPERTRQRQGRRGGVRPSGAARWRTGAVHARHRPHGRRVGQGADRRAVIENRRNERRSSIGGSDGRYLPTGHLVYALGGVVFARPFDLRRLEVTGGPVPDHRGCQASQRWHLRHRPVQHLQHRFARVRATVRSRRRRALV